MEDREQGQYLLDIQTVQVISVNDQAILCDQLLGASFRLKKYFMYELVRVSRLQVEFQLEQEIKPRLAALLCVQLIRKVVLRKISHLFPEH